MPAGFTYFGQFVDHDITKLKRSADPPQSRPVRTADLIQERTPALDLDALYGAGLSDAANIPYTADGEFDSPFRLPPVKHRRLTDLPRRLQDLSASLHPGVRVLLEMTPYDFDKARIAGLADDA